MNFFRLTGMTSCLSMALVSVLWPDLLPPMVAQTSPSLSTKELLPLKQVGVGVSSSPVASQIGVSNPTRLKGKTVSWSKASEGSFCSLIPQSQALTAKVPEVPVIPQKRFLAASFTTRLGEAIESAVYWVESSKTTKREQVVIEVNESPQPNQVKKPKSSFWASLPQPQKIFTKQTPFEKKEFYLLVNGQPALKLANRKQLQHLADRLEELANQPNFDASQIRLSSMGGHPVAMVGDHLLFIMDEAFDNETNKELLAIEWFNNLRKAFDLHPLSVVESQKQMYGITESENTLQGLASWYGPYFHGRLTANGEIYNQEAFTAAHKSLPFNTFLKITNLETEEEVIIRINDRGPYIPPRTLDLSLGIARCLNGEHMGVIPYHAVMMKPNTKPSLGENDI